MTRYSASMDQGSSDRYGREWAILSQVKPGDRLFTDDGFTCMRFGEAKIVRRNEEGQLYVPCRDGRHYLDAQLEHGRLIGFYTRLYR